LIFKNGMVFYRVYTRRRRQYIPARTADKGRIRMKRLFVGAAIVALVSVPGTASAHEGHGSCKEFGQGAAAEAQELGGLGGVASAAAPVNDEVAFLHGLLCE
jgi:hypothetical protein